MPSAGTLKNLRALGTVSSPAASVTQLQLQVWVNGTISTGLLCNVTLTADATGNGGPTPCSDSVDSVSVNAGDTVSMYVTGQTTATGVSPGLNASLEKQ
jgi:hypothetical protein